MDVNYDRCCGLDVHKKTVVARVITPEGQETRTIHGASFAGWSKNTHQACANHLAERQPNERARPMITIASPTAVTTENSAAMVRFKWPVRWCWTRPVAR